MRGGGGAAPASQSSDCTTSDRRPGKVLSVINYYDDAAFDCDSWSGLQNFVSGRETMLWDKMPPDLVIIIFC